MLEEIPVYVKLKNSYNPAHYPANKKISAEEWNALWMSTMYQGNHQEDVLASILNVTLPEFRLEINEMGSKYSEALSKAEEALGISNEALDTADEAKDIALEAKDIADQSLIDINLKQNITDEGLNTTDKTIVGAINEVKTNSVAIANIINNLYSTDIDKPLSANMGNALREMVQGQEFGKAYFTIEDMVSALNEAEQNAFKVAFMLLIVDLEVPDFWVAEVMETSVPYTYTTDESLIEAVKTEPLQIGYYKISISETAKVDLTNYVQKNFTIAGLNLEENITKSALQTALDFNTLVGEAPIDNKQYVRKDASWQKSSRLEDDNMSFIEAGGNILNQVENEDEGTVLTQFPTGTAQGHFDITNSKQILGGYSKNDDDGENFTVNVFSGEFPTGTIVKKFVMSENGTNEDEVAKIKDLPIVVSATNVVVTVEDWVADTTYADYGYKADLTLTGILATYEPSVVFGLTEVESGNYASVCLAGENTITIYAKEIPSASITIPLIKGEEL